MKQKDNMTQTRKKSLNLWRNMPNQKTWDKTRRRVAGGVIINNEMTHIVLVRNHESGKWGIPKGGIEKGETDIEGAIREIREETGIEIESAVMPMNAPCITYRGVRIFLFCYKGNITNLNLNPLDTLEISHCAWFSIKNLLLTLKSKNSNSDNRLPVISTEFLTETYQDFGGGIFEHNPPKEFLMTTLLRDLLTERLDPIKKKIKTNIDNYAVCLAKKDTIQINGCLAKFLNESRKAGVRQINTIHDIQEQWPMVFYVPELLKALEAVA